MSGAEIYLGLMVTFRFSKHFYSGKQNIPLKFKNKTISAIVIYIFCIVLIVVISLGLL